MPATPELFIAFSILPSGEPRWLDVRFRFFSVHVHFLFAAFSSFKKSYNGLISSKFLLLVIFQETRLQDNRSIQRESSSIYPFGTTRKVQLTSRTTPAPRDSLDTMFQRSPCGTHANKVSAFRSPSSVTKDSSTTHCSKEVRQASSRQRSSNHIASQPEEPDGSRGRFDFSAIGRRVWRVRKQISPPSTTTGSQSSNVAAQGMDVSSITNGQGSGAAPTFASPDYASLDSLPSPTFSTPGSSLSSSSNHIFRPSSIFSTISTFISDTISSSSSRPSDWPPMDGVPSGSWSSTDDTPLSTPDQLPIPSTITLTPTPSLTLEPTLSESTPSSLSMSEPYETSEESSFSMPPSSSVPIYEPTTTQEESSSWSYYATPSSEYIPDESSASSSAPSSSVSRSSTVTEEPTTSSQPQSTTFMPTMPSSSSYQTSAPPSPSASPSSSSSRRPNVTLMPAPAPDISSFTSTSFESSTRRPVTTVTQSRFTTLTITTVFTSTYSGGMETTVTTVIETGILRTDVPAPTSGLANNVSAIIGLTLGATFAIIGAIILLFFCCRRYRRTHKRGDSAEHLNPQREWRSPLRDEEEGGKGFLYGASAVASRIGRKLSNRSMPSNEGTFVAEDMRRNDERVHGRRSESTEGVHSTFPPPLNAFNAPPPLPGMEDMGEGPTNEELGYLPSNPSSTAHDHTDSAAVAAVYDLSGSKSPSTTSKAGHATSSASLLTSAHGSVEGGRSMSTRKRVSLPGPRPLPASRNTKRHSSTPPVSFPMHGEPQSNEMSEKGSLRGLLGRLGKRRGSAGSSMTVRPTPSSSQIQIHNPFGSSESLEAASLAVPTPAHTLSGRTPPSSFLYPSNAAFMQPGSSSTPPPLLTFPRGVTGNGYVQENQPVVSPAPPLWPTFTLPPPPSPTDDSASVVKEGLLHPRLSMAPSESFIASRTSFDDHEDYSRPIGGVLIRGHRLSANTLERGSSMSSFGSKNTEPKP
ncbi:hypothetical protein CC1G_11373 [Coprinopsis cinerea okayama7|uniref:Uncharacterized protein n=1 Tax=Coprinopsis cinerea (strain Okayama-7 / 130 / ATCC MYA-4618 / FGSC 9003) TaxID=240176 RepID=A8P8Y3_COPC7|nr:hypothetical protein CC1G_11373 [Coprinopsis cinerea okayama7\|eukprot:XP_001839662.2 hypothetical protein CC1G_11373 [Coprinopsis cinerea okayama7\